MTLVIWTSAKTQDIKRAFEPVISRQKIDHRIEPDMSAVPILQDGDVLLACGTTAYEKLKHYLGHKKKLSVGSLRNRLFPGTPQPTFLTYDPGIANKDWSRLPDLMWDCTLAVRQHQHGHTQPKLGTYRWVESFHELIQRVEAQYAKTGKKVPLSCDLETKGLDEYAPGTWIISIFFTLEKGTAEGTYFTKQERPMQPADMDAPEGYWEELWMQLHWLLTSEKIAMRGANFKFDSRWLVRHWNIYCTNLVFDIVLAGSLLDENRSNSLKLHAKIYTDMGGYDDELDTQYDKGSMEEVPLPVLLTYAGGDTDATQQSAEVIRKELLKDDKLTNFYANLLHPSSRTFEKMERNGICVDVEYYHDLKAELETELKSLDKQMLAMLPNKLKYKYADNLSLTRPVLIRDLFFTPMGFNVKPSQFTEKDGLPSTAIDHLLTFGDDPVAKAFVDLLKARGSASKTLGTYVVGFMKHLRSDGRFHPTYLLSRQDYGGDDDDSGAVTGRTSCKDPAAQTVPKHTKWTKKLRRAFVPPPGKTILQIDYSQGELKITACLAEEPTMLQSYMNGIDLHAVTAAQLNGYTMEDFMLLPEDTRDALRSGGKAGNFGLIYGMGADGFRDYARSSYGVVFTEAESAQKREAFFDLYNALPKWHTNTKNFARRWGYVRSPLGRVRHLPLITSPNRSAASAAERQAVNSPVQSCLSDMMQLAMTMIDREYGHINTIEMFLMTHDACAWYVPIDEATIWAKRFKDIMDNLPLKKMFGWDHQLQFTTDAEICDPTKSPDGVLSFAYLKKLKGL